MTPDPVLLLRCGPVSCWSIGRDLDGKAFDAGRSEDIGRLCHRLEVPGTVRQCIQEHGTVIDEDGESPACDAFLLRPGQSALIRHADCFPVVVADPVRSCAILAHCGWRGTGAGLAGDCVRRLVRDGSRPEDLVAAIGAGIGPSSFEVGPDVLRTFPERFHVRTSWGTFSVDLPGVLRSDLESAGVPRIEMRSPDTFTDPDWHSFRRDGSHSGRNATICIVV